MTAEEIVKAKWPDAWAEVQLGMRLEWIIWPKAHASSNYPMKSLCGFKPSEAEAWQSAASRIQRDPVEQEGAPHE